MTRRRGSWYDPASAQSDAGTLLVWILSASSTAAADRHRTRILAISVSLLAHAGLAVALTRLEWPSAEPPPPLERPVVWLRVPPPLPPATRDVTEAPLVDRPEPEAPLVEDNGRSEPEAPVAQAPEIEQIEPQSVVNDEPKVSTEDEPEVSAAEEPEVRPTEEPQRATAAAPPISVPEEPAPAERPTASDLYTEGHDAAARIVEQQAAEKGYQTFSTDLFEEGPVEPPNPREDIFEPGRSSRPALMQPGKSSSRIGRWVSKTCNELMGGGISLFGIATLCADSNGRSDLFSDIKPAYLKSLPVCEETDAESPFEADRAAGIPAVKCRLEPIDY
jgi:hypothetical protein